MKNASFSGHFGQESVCLYEFTEAEIMAGVNSMSRQCS